jgi:hypothetical protein
MSRISTRKGGKLSAEFDSVPDVFRVIKKLGWQPQRDKASNRQSEGNGQFYTFKNLADSLDVFENHPERIRKFNQLDDRLLAYESPGNDVQFDVTGDYIDIGRFLEGVPEVMGYSTLGNPRTIFCTINILTSFVHYTDAKYVLAKQARVLRLVDWLETQGIRCQIVAAEDSECLYMSTVVKEFQDPLDINHLAIVMHPDWLRRVTFLIEEQSNTWTWGYGSAIEYDTKMKKYQPNPEDGLYVYVGGYMPFGNFQNGTDGIKMLNEAFDNIEAGIQDTIDRGMTFNEDPLTITGSKSRY